MNKNQYAAFIETQKNNLEIPYGYCHCGCGQETTIAKKNDVSKGWTKGEPVLFVRYHQYRCYDPGICEVEGCARKAVAKGKCEAHWRRIRDKYNVDPKSPIKSQRRKGEGTITAAGYRKHQVDGRTIIQHRAVMEEILGRALLPDEQVHHINGVRSDNRPENLELWSSSHPCGQRAMDKVQWAWKIIELYDSQFNFRPDSRRSLASRLG